MAWIIGKKADESILEISNKTPDFYLSDHWVDKRDWSILATQAEIDACAYTNEYGVSTTHACFVKGLKTVIPEKLGGSASDYSFLQLNTEEIDKILDGQSYTINWVSGEIDNIDFTLEESKPWAKVSCDKEYILNDGIEEAALTVEIWKPDLSELDTSFQFPNVRIPIKTPNGSKIVRFDIVNGTATKKFKTNVAGDYVFPAVSKRFNSVRIFNQIAIDVDDNDILS